MTVKPKHKLWISMAILWAIFFLVTYLSAHYLLAPTSPTIPYAVPVTEHSAELPFTIFSVITIAVIAAFLFLKLTKKMMLKRISRLVHEVIEISENNELSRRLQEHDYDELATLTRQINTMLDTLESAQHQIEHHIQSRTHELQLSNQKLKQEITERLSAEKELIVHKEHLVRLAHYDSLTTLPNRVFFNEMLTKILNHAKRHRQTIAVLFIDLDRFKHINDALGHANGDLVLKEAAARFTSALRSGDILARLGGDEFIVLLNDIHHAKYASTVAEKLLQAITPAIKINNHDFFIGASIGVATFPNDGTSLEDLMRNADIAMYQAKRTGGSNFKYYTSEMDNEAHHHVKLETALRRAIDNNEFILHFQPELNLTDGSVASVEALIRWEDPELGLINPDKFISLAEETGLIIPIGEWVLLEACRVNKSWQAQGYQPVAVAVNLSPMQFKSPNLIHCITHALEETGLDPRYLEIEITETAVMENVDSAIKKLQEIKALGVSITIDDFGTGYTSISYLKRFPASIVKIDRSFVKGIPNNPDDASITAAVIALAHNLGLKVVGEGVETPEQLQFLADHSCDYVQGYYLSRPLPESKIVYQLIKLPSSPRPKAATA